MQLIKLPRPPHYSVNIKLEALLWYQEHLAAHSEPVSN